MSRRSRIAHHELGWRLGRAGTIGPDLWIPYDRTTTVIGPQGCGKTLSVLAPALLDAPGGALVTLTKPDDLFLTISRRSEGGRPVAVLDPFGLAPGLPELVWDPIAGCDRSLVAERRAKAFAAGTLRATASAGEDSAARFYAGECAKVLQAFFHAAALGGANLDTVLEWVAEPRQSHEASELLRRHTGAEPHWHGLLHGALRGDERTAGNTITTVQQTMSLFFQSSLRNRCVPSPGRPPTDLRTLVANRGTVYLLGREDPYASAAPLMTAIAEDVLDIAKNLGETSLYGRLCPPFLACLDELPSTAPIPTLATRMANERALGVSFILAAQTWRQVVVCFGQDLARTILGLSNNLVVFGGGKDVAFYREVAELLGSATHMERRPGRIQTGVARAGETWSSHRVPVMEPAELRAVARSSVLVVPDGTAPVIARLRSCIEGSSGRQVLAQQEFVRASARAAPRSQ